LLQFYPSLLCQLLSIASLILVFYPPLIIYDDEVALKYSTFDDS
jgi:hypothetical protein